MKKFYLVLLLAIFGTVITNVLRAQISLTASNGSYTENFDGMGTTGTTLPTGWTAIRYAGSGTANATLTPSVTNGSSTSGGIYNVGSSTAPANADRALGTLASGSTIPAFGASFTNNTATTITDFNLSGSSEQWRSGTSSTANEIVAFEYSTNATSLSTGTWTSISSLNLTEILTTTTTGAAVDGNTNKVAISGTISSINLAVGSTIWIRWRDNDDSGSDGMYALDDFGLNWANAAVSNTATIAAGTNAAEPSTNGTFTVTLNNAAPAGGVTVNYILSGTASPGVDYSNTQTGSINIPQGSTTGTITINVLDDATLEPSETITATLTSANNSYSVNTTPASISLTDNDGTAIYSYNFTGCTSALSDGFTQQSVAGAEVWSCTTFGREGNGVQMNGFASGNQNNEDWLISPPIDLSATTNPVLTFYSRTKFAGEPLRLFVTTSFTGDVTTTTWTEIDGRFPPVGSDVWTLSDGISLAAFNQANVRFAFKYVSTTAAASRWTLDDINIFEANTAPAPSLTVNGNLLDFREVAAGTTSPEKTFTFWANNLTSDLTITAPAGFQLSKDGSTYSNSVSYTAAETQNQQKTVYVRFSPSTPNTVYSGYLQFTSTGINQQKIFVKGHSYPSASTLNVVAWNLEWFGSPTNGPADDNQQQANAKTVMDYLNADIFAMEEIVDTARFGNLVRSLAGGYNYVVTNYTSNAPDPSDPDYATSQKLALVYKTSVISNVTARGLMKSSATAVSNWATGRVPFLVNATVTKNGGSANMDFIVVHGKAGSTQSDYDRRKAGAKELKDTLDVYFSTSRVIILGDYNDDLDQSIYIPPSGPIVSSYTDLITDSTDADSYKSTTIQLSYFGLSSTATHPEVIDHTVISNEIVPWYVDLSATLYNDIGALTGIANYSTTTSDHFPIMTNYVFNSAVLPVKLTSFTGTKENNAVRLDWQTSDEVDTKEFIIERSANGRNFEPIGTKQAAGNSSAIRNYSFTDLQPLPGNNIYRLKMVDRDGRFELSKLVKITFGSIYSVTVAPNPVTSSFYVTTTFNGPAYLQMMDMNGRVVKKQVLVNQKEKVSVSHLQKGVYVVKILNATETFTQKITVQ